MKIRGYDVEARPLADDLGGGFVAFAPALKGCLADGDSAAAALEHLEDAVECWLVTAGKKGRHIPRPEALMPIDD